MGPEKGLRIRKKGRKSANSVDPDVAKVGRLQSQGAKGEAVVVYCEPFATQDLQSSDFPGG